MADYAVDGGAGDGVQPSEPAVGHVFPCLRFEPLYAELGTVDVLTAQRSPDVLAALTAHVATEYRTIRELAPSIRDGIALELLLPRRARNLLARHGQAMGAEFPDLIVAEVGDWEGAGVGTVHAIAAAVVTIALRAQGADGLTVDAAGAANAADAWARLADDARLLIEWGGTVHGAPSLGAALDHAVTGAPPDVEQAVASLRSASPFELEMTGAPIAALLDEIARELEEREFVVWRSRKIDGGRTLDSLGDEYGVTRERIRQIERSAAEKVAMIRRRSCHRRAAWLVDALQRAAGSAIPVRADVVHELLAAAGGDGFARRVLLHFAGLRLVGDWLVDSPDASPYAPSALRSAVRDCALERRLLDDAVRQCVIEGGVPIGFVDDWLFATEMFRDIDGASVLWVGSAVDQAVALLMLTEDDWDLSELVGKVAEGRNERGVRGQILGDARIVRTGSGRVGLRVWGRREYSGIAAAIEDEIAAAGGSVRIDDLVAAIAPRDGVAENSIRIYCTVPRFVTERGRVRLRRPDEPYENRSRPAHHAGVYRSGEDGIVWRVPVTSDVLRGSGLHLPAGIAYHVGLPVGAELRQHVDGNEIRVQWQDASTMGPTIGSLRGVAIDLDAAEDDFLLITFCRAGPTEVRAVDRALVARQPRLERLAVLVGLAEDAIRDESGTPDLLISIAHACWLDVGREQGADPAARIQQALVERGERPLGSLLDAEPAR